MSEQDVLDCDLLEGVLSVLDVAILVIGPEGTVRHANPAAARLLQLPAEQLVGAPAERFLDDGAGQSPRLVRRALPGNAGTHVLLFDERAQLFEELFATLSALNHQINNPLTALLGRAQILKMKESLDPQVTKAVAVIEESAKRIAGHVRELSQVLRASKERTLGAKPERV